MKYYDVVAFGGATKDIFLFLKTSYLVGLRSYYIEIPANRKLEVDEIREYTGGSATNAAATFRAFGKKVLVISRIGKDDNGKFVKADLEGRGIEYKFSYTKVTPFTVVITTEGEMSLLVYRGPQENWNANDIRFNGRTRLVYIGPMPASDIEVTKKAIEIGKKNNAIIVWNPGSSEIDMGINELRSLISNVDIICMNDDEVKRFTGVKNPVDGAKLLGKLAKVAIVTLGSKGSITVKGDKLYRAGVYPAKQINFVGAGDAFCAGFSNAILDNKPIEIAISLGAYNAASVVSHYGAKEGIVNSYPKELLNIKVEQI
jgi:ribokinase